ncbi:MAG: restriction endonuclease subunit S, partial [Lachnospiraceae bacterium]|nr:restriction endonuclease subunit S [Lachnospiraceae bacterium]
MTPEQLRMSILHAAFQGKLVEQRAEEGDAELLYKQCQSDISTAIKLGEIKKQKPLSEITDDDIVFDIPSSWRNIKLGEVSQLIDGEKVKGKEYKYLEVKYLRGSIEAKTLTEGKLAKQGQLAILVDGENSGEVFTLPEDGYLGSTFKVLYIVNTIDVEYVLKFFELKRSELRANKKGAAIPHLNKDLLFNYVLPLPPLEEQHRIVAKIEELLPYVDRYAEAYEKLEQFNAKFPEDMKKSILQYAIQGKLVEQRPEEGTAEELYQQIQDEKQRL